MVALVLASLLIPIAASLLALLVPRRIADRLWNDLSWVVAVGGIVAIFFHESRWFV